MRTATLLTLITLALGCKEPTPGTLYSPCRTAADCEPLVSDGCATPQGSQEGWCTVLCQADVDCPAGLDGTPAACIQTDADLRVCQAGSGESAAEKPSLVKLAPTR